MRHDSFVGPTDILRLRRRPARGQVTPDVVRCLLTKKGVRMITAEQLASCSFCLKAHTEVGTLVAGPGVYICDECVDLSSQLVASKPKSGKPTTVQRIAPWDAEAGVDAVLTSLPRVAQAGRQADYILTQYVRKARELGATWAAIGEALGMARQSAWERFSGEE